jgi:hypothetical protein
LRAFFFNTADTLRFDEELIGEAAWAQYAPSGAVIGDFIQKKRAALADDFLILLQRFGHNRRQI